MSNSRRADFSYDSEARIVYTEDAWFYYNAASVRNHFASTILVSGTWGTKSVYETSLHIKESCSRPNQSA